MNLRNILFVFVFRGKVYSKSGKLVRHDVLVEEKKFVSPAKSEEMAACTSRRARRCQKTYVF